MEQDRVFLMMGFLLTGLLTCLTLAEPAPTKKEEDVRVVGQCFKPTGPFSFVSLYCGYQRVIRIKAAFHGSHKNPSIAHCGQLRGDCTRDITHQYKWTSCEGHHSCVQRLHLQLMPSCDDNDMQYLQVDYTCVEGTETVMTTEAETVAVHDIKSSEKESKKESTSPGAASTMTTRVVDASSAVKVREVCSNHSGKAEMLAITSPGYPTHYWSDTDCRCIIQAAGASQVTVTYYDLGLVQSEDVCVDWLLVQSLGHRVPATVTCGRLQDDTRTITTKGNWALLHFHTASMGGIVPGQRIRKAMPGFKITIFAKPGGEFKFQCYTTDPSVLASLKYKDSKDGKDTLLLPATDLNTLGKTASPSKLPRSTSSHITPHHVCALLCCFLISFTHFTHFV